MPGTSPVWRPSFRRILRAKLGTWRTRDHAASQHDRTGSALRHARLRQSTHAQVLKPLDLPRCGDQKPGMRRSTTILRWSTVLLMLSSSAAADFAESDYSDYDAPPPERRDGFTAGITYTAGYGSTVGYPNKLGEIGDAAYEQRVNGFGGGYTLWLGAALRDWFAFGIGIGAQGVQNDGQTSAGGSFLVRLEGFPLFTLGEEYRDLGIFANFGAGSSVVLDEDEDVVANGGSVSVIQAGAFYEPWSFWSMATGPTLQYSYQFSQSITVHMVTAGWRLAYYGTLVD